MSRMCTRSSLYFDVTQMVFFHSWMSWEMSAPCMLTIPHLKNAAHDTADDHGRALGEAAHELIEELLGTDLKLDGVTAVLNDVVEDAECNERLVWVARVDVDKKGLSRFASPGLSATSVYHHELTSWPSSC